MCTLFSFEQGKSYSLLFLPRNVRKIYVESIKCFIYMVCGNPLLYYYDYCARGPMYIRRFRITDMASNS